MMIVSAAVFSMGAGGVFLLGDALAAHPMLAAPIMSITIMLTLAIPVLTLGPRCPVCSQVWTPLRLRTVRDTRGCVHCNTAFRD